MISSMYQQGECLYSLSSNTLSVYELGDFLLEGQSQLPKIQSPLGMSLRQASAQYTIPELSPFNECKFVNIQEKKNIFLMIYDNKTIVAVYIRKIVNGIKMKKTMCENDNDKQIVKVDWKYGVQAEEEIASAMCFHDEKGKQRLIINTTKGRILLLTYLQGQEQSNLHLSQQSVTSLQALRSIPNINKQMYNQNNTFISNYLSVNNSNSSLKQYKQHITAITINNKNILYCATTQNRLIAVDKEMKLVGEVDLKKELVEEYSRPKKIVIVRNSLIVLYSQCLIQFNTHTFTVTNSLPLPFNTLDLAVQYHPKTQCTTFVMVGQCNSFYSIPYPWNMSKQKFYPSFKKVTISSKLGKSILQTNNYLFVGGCDGTIDVYKNASMHMMVLLQL